MRRESLVVANIRAPSEKRSFSERHCVGGDRFSRSRSNDTMAGPVSICAALAETGLPIAGGREIMNRRQVIAGASVGVAAAASGYPKPAIAQGARELKMVTIWPNGWPGLQCGTDRVAQAITALSGGRLQVKVFPAGQLVGAMESFDAVSSGLADFYHGSEVTWAGKSATFAYFCNVPFGFTADELNAWVYDG